MSTSSHEDKHDLVAEDLEARQAHEQGLHAASSAAVPPVQVRTRVVTPGEGHRREDRGGARAVAVMMSPSRNCRRPPSSSPSPSLLVCPCPAMHPLTGTT